MTVEEFVLRHKRRGAVFLLSDFLTPDAVEEACRLLRFNKYQVFLVHVLSEEELNPSIAGLYQLVDSETNQQHELFIDHQALAVYREVLAEFTGRLETFSHKHGILYVKAPTTTPFEAIMMQFFRGKGHA